MFHTSYTKVFRQYKCDEGCQENGGCPGHKMELIINNTVGVAEFRVDEVCIYWFGCNGAQALYDMFKQIEEDPTGKIVIEEVKKANKI